MGWPTYKWTQRKNHFKSTLVLWYHELCSHAIEKAISGYKQKKRQFGMRNTASGFIIFHYRKPCFPLLKFITMANFTGLLRWKLRDRFMCSTVYLAETCHLPYRSNWPACMEETSIPLQFEFHRYSNNSVDCGLFAIANIVQFAMGTTSEKTSSSLMWNSFANIWCIVWRGNTWHRSPALKQRAKLNKKKTIYVDISCDCTTNGEMMYFLLICKAAILQSEWWIPTQQNI